MPVRLLIAEDEDTIRKGVVKYIQLHTDRFTRIYEAENGQKAVELLLKYHPDMLLLDMQMPLKNGMDVMEEARKAGLHPITVVLSGYDEFKYAQQAIKFGAKEYLLKPVRASDILDLLNCLADEYIGLEEKAENMAEEDQKQGNPLVKTAKEYMEEHYMEDISLAGVAEKLGISQGYLSTMLKSSLGLGFVEYLHQIRIDHACCYLEQNYLKNYEIAYKVGFQDEKYFSKIFKKVKGVSPKEYRKKGSHLHEIEI